MSKILGALELNLDEIKKLLSSTLNCNIKRIKITKESFYIITWYSSFDILKNDLNEVLYMKYNDYDFEKLKEKNVWGVSDKGYENGVGFVYELKHINRLLNERYGVKIIDMSNYLYNERENNIIFIINH